MEEVTQIEFDFTPSKIFSKRKIKNIHSTLLKMIPSNYPWSIKNNQSSLYSEQRELFVTGTKEEVAKKLEYIQYMDCKLCERCGATIHTIPWHIEMTICSKCKNELDIEYGSGKFPWGWGKLKTNTTENTNNLWWLYL